ncbi:MAG: glycosyltransferase family 92 protein [Clostridiaceae bacterium]|nr:glycosyltransferase family 92 protein [Clostridiaceae bacterium]
MSEETTTNHGNKCRLAVHTVFLARENILFLKEWLIYHIEIGVDHFYLYDNSSAENNRKVNKYGIPYAKITEGMTDSDIQDTLKEIQQDLPGRITYIEWSPENEHGKKIFGQLDAIRDYVEKYGCNSDWTAFIDIDEFIFSPEGRTLKDYLEEYEKRGIEDLVLHQKKFEERYNNLDKYVIQNERCIEGVNTIGWACKHIIRNDNINLTALIEKRKGCNIHYIPIKRGKYFDVKMDELRFNHYNTNKKLLDWMKGYYHAEEDFYLNATDNGMRKYWKLVEEKCSKHCANALLKQHTT